MVLQTFILLENSIYHVIAKFQAAVMEVLTEIKIVHDGLDKVEKVDNVRGIQLLSVVASELAAPAEDFQKKIVPLQVQYC